MGLFGKKFDEKAALLSFFSPQAGQMYSSRKKGEEKAEKAAKELARIHATIDADPSLPTPEAKAYAKMNPEAYTKAYMSRFETRQFGPGGGSIMTPGAGGGQWQQAPSRHEYQGSVFDVGATVPGQKAAVTPQHQGTQWVTPQPGTSAFPVDSFTGLERMPPPADGAPPSGTPMTDQDIARMEREAQGGRPPQGRAPFRPGFPY